MSVSEPGIGLMLLVCIFQFIVGNLILVLLELKHVTYFESLYKNFMKKSYFKMMRSENKVICFK